MLLLDRLKQRPSALPPKGLEKLRLVRSPCARRVALRVDPARGDICLVLPKRGSEKTAWRFADQNREWINERLSTMEKPIPFVDGTVIPILGAERTLRIAPSKDRTTEIILNARTLDVRTPREDAHSNIRNFLYGLMEDAVKPLAEAKAKIIDKTIGRIQLRDTRSRWGSCRRDGKLMFSWRLIFAPTVVMDYIIGHEIAHFVHMDHSPAFWDLCDELSEDMEYGRDWLDANGDKLLMYGLQT